MTLPVFNQSRLRMWRNVKTAAKRQINKPLKSHDGGKQLNVNGPHSPTGKISQLNYRIPGEITQVVPKILLEVLLIIC